MKKILLLLISGLGCITVLHTQSPVAYYPFDNNANDMAGTANGIANSVILSNERRFTVSNGMYQCYTFNGTSSNINLGNNSVHRPTGSITISAWFRLDNTAAALTGRSLVSCAEASGYNMYYEKAGDILLFQVFRNGSWGTASFAAGLYKENGWHHIAGTFDGRYTKLYLDGELKSTNDAGNSYPIDYSYPLGQVNTYIGAEAQAAFTIDPNYYWEGKIDEVKFYHTALNAAQIKSDIQFLPGAGKAFQSGNNYMYKNAITGINDFGVNQDFTIECWFKAPVTQASTSAVVNSLIGQIDPNKYNYSIHIYNPPHVNNGRIEVMRWDGTVFPYLQSNSPLNDNQWHHLAFVRSGGSSGLLSLYIDGVLQGSITDNTTNSLTGYYFQAGGTGNGFGNFSGELDELRIWNIGLTQTQVRDRMCRKITSADALWNNLTVYHRFDEQVNSGGGYGIIPNDSRIENMSANYQVAVVPYGNSGAAIGTSSSHDYSATPSVSISHPQGESLSVTATSGSPAGIHVYSVREKPNNSNGAAGTGLNDRYFGVFVAGGTNPQYTAVYNYTGNPYVNAGNESSLILNKRDNSAAPSWSNSLATLNTTANTLTVTGQNTEYMLGLSTGVLPVSLLDFVATKQADRTLLKWRTASELNNAGFEVQHSTDGVRFNHIGFVAGAGNSSSILEYSFIHLQPVKGNNYYRLAQRDVNGRTSNSRVNLVRFDDQTLISFFPNPVTDQITVLLPQPLLQLSLLDYTGKTLWSSQEPGASQQFIPVRRFPAGIYFLQATDLEQKRSLYKIVRQ